MSKGKMDDKMPDMEDFLKAIREDRIASVSTPNVSYVYVSGDGVLSTGMLSKTIDGKNYLYDRDSKTWKLWGDE